MEKVTLINEIRTVSKSIDRLALKDSLATLDHKLKVRQKLLERLFNTFTAELDDEDMAFLQSIKQTSNSMLSKMESEKHNKADEIIKHKSKGNRIRLYTSIAKQK